MTKSPDLNGPGFWSLTWSGIECRRVFQFSIQNIEGDGGRVGRCSALA